MGLTPGSVEVIHENTPPLFNVNRGEERADRLPFSVEMDDRARSILQAKEVKDLNQDGSLRQFARHIIADSSFDTSPNGLGDPVDSRYQRILGIFEAYAKREEEIEFKDASREFASLKRDIDEEVEKKRLIESILKTGNFLAHGGYSGEFESIAKEGGLMSSGARINKGLIESEKIPRWARVGLSGHSEQNAIFFYPWKDEHAGTYESNEYDARGSTDICYLYPAENVAKNSRMIRVKPYYKNDIAVTTSKASLAMGNLVRADDDETFLPLKEAYLVVPSDRRKKIEKDLVSAGYSNEWIQDHIFTVKIKRQTAKYALMPNRPENNMTEVLQKQKEEINSWLARVYKKPETRILLKRLDNKTPGEYGGPGDSYAPIIVDENEKAGGKLTL